MKSKQNTRQTRAAAARAYEASLAGVLDALDGRGARGRVAAATALRDACRTGRVAEAAVLGSVETAGDALARLVRRGGAERAAALDALAAFALCAGPARALCAAAHGACVGAGTGDALRTAALVCAACSEDRDTTHEACERIAAALGRAKSSDTRAGAVAAWTLLRSVADARPDTLTMEVRSLWAILQLHFPPQSSTGESEGVAATTERATATAKKGEAELADALSDAMLLLEDQFFRHSNLAECVGATEEEMTGALRTLAMRWPSGAARVACVLAHRGADEDVLAARARGLPPGVVLRDWRTAVRAAALLRALQPAGLAHHVRSNAVVREMLGLPATPPPSPDPRPRGVVDPSSAQARHATRSRAAERDSKAQSFMFDDDCDDDDDDDDDF